MGTVHALKYAPTNGLGKDIFAPCLDLQKQEIINHLERHKWLEGCIWIQWFPGVWIIGKCSLLAT